MKLNGAQILVDCLKSEGVKHIFGYPGGAVLHIYDALDACTTIDHILVRHEQGAVHAADGYARTSGKCGVSLVTSGPGLTNAVTGIATAFTDSIPMVVISGQVPSPVIGSDAFQEVDAVGITRSCVKHNFLVKNANDLAETVKKAFYIATTGRPGPVLIDITKDATIAEIEYEGYPETIKMRSYQPEVQINAEQVAKAIAIIEKAQKPIIYSGGGSVIGNASETLTTLAHSTGFPITQTLMGLGAYPATDKQSLGMLGMHGTYESNMAMHDSDCIIAVGARFDDRITGNLEKFCPYAKIIHIDIDPSSVGKVVGVDVSVIGQVNDVLHALIQSLKDKTLPNIDTWWQQINEWRKVDSLAYKTAGGVIKPQTVIETLYEVTNGQAIVTSDVGQHQMWAAQHYKFDKPNRWMTSGGLGTMGYGLPAAVGVQVAHPKKLVVDIAGEASILMTMQEISTAIQYNLPIKIFILNNQYMGMVRQWQELLHEKNYSESYSEALPDFVKLAEAYGCVGIRAENPDELDEKIQEMINIDSPVIFDCHVDQAENCFPMIPSGKPHNQMLLGPKDQEENKITGKGKALV